MSWSLLKNPQFLKNTTLEILLLLGVIAGYFLVLHHINSTAWRDMLFTNSDMLTLPLVSASLHLHEPFNWVFSSQIFLFPEALLYTFSSLFSNNFKVTLLIDAFLSITFLYILIRVLAATLTKNHTHRRAFALFYMLAILFLMAIEGRNNSIAMYFFVTTAYYGVILSSLLVLACSLTIYKNIGQKNKALQRRWLLGICFTVALFTGISNPLFFLQFSAPFIAVIVGMLLLKLVDKRSMLLLILPHLISLPLSILIRKVAFNSYFSPLGDISNYLHFGKILTTLKQYRDITRQMLTGPLPDRIEILLILIITLSGIILLFTLVWKKIRQNKTFLNSLSNQSTLLIAFAITAPVATFCGTILTGNALLRYLLPVIFFTPLFLLPLFQYIDAKASRILTITLPIIATLIILIGLTYHPVDTARQLATYYPADAACLDTSLAGTPYNAGVAQYWRARSLQLNSKAGHIVVQVDGSLKRFSWLYNTTSYDLYDLSFVVVDKPELNASLEVSNDPMFAIPTTAVQYALGQPSRIYQCASFDIYAYDKGTPGHFTLNKTVRDRSKGL